MSIPYIPVGPVPAGGSVSIEDVIEALTQYGVPTVDDLADVGIAPELEEAITGTYGIVQNLGGAPITNASSVNIPGTKVTVNQGDESIAPFTINKSELGISDMSEIASNGVKLGTILGKDFIGSAVSQTSTTVRLEVLMEAADTAELYVNPVEAYRDYSADLQVTLAAAPTKPKTVRKVKVYVKRDNLPPVTP